MTKTVLYYPTITISDSPWLRQSLLYFDKIASIVPRTVWNPDEGRSTVPLTPDHQSLYDEGIYEPVDPESLVGEGAPTDSFRILRLKDAEERWQTAHRLGYLFKARVQDEQFKRSVSTKFVKIHPGKLHATLLPFLEQEGLLRYDAPDGEWYRAEWLLVEEKTALLYMSMLAKTMAEMTSSKDSEVEVVTGTDNIKYETLLYKAEGQEQATPTLEVILKGLLPVPREDVAFDDILSFKRKRVLELRNYRQWIESITRDLKRANEVEELKDILSVAETTQKKNLCELQALLKDGRIVTSWGTLKALISANSPALWATLLAGAGTATGEISTSSAIGGVLAAAAIQVGAYRSKERMDRNQMLRQSPFTYVLLAKKEGLLQATNP